METRRLNDITKETTATPDQFIAMAGEIRNGENIEAAMQLKTSTTWGKGNSKTEPKISLMTGMTIDGEYANFYHAGENIGEFDNFAQACEAYNASLEDNPEMSQYMLQNVPEGMTNMQMGYSRGEGYRASVSTCIILGSVPSTLEEGKSVVLAIKNGKYAIVDNIDTDNVRNYVFSDKDFAVEDLQEALDNVSELSINKSKEQVIEQEGQEQQAPERDDDRDDR